MTIRLPTFSQHIMQSIQISSQYESVARLQQQVSNGKKLQQTSDDSLLGSQIKSVESYLDRLNGYELNTTLAVNRMSMYDSVLGQADSLIIKSQELVMKAQNGTLNNNDRVAIGIELNGILESFVSLANTQDGNGTFIFNGYANGAAYVKIGEEYVYQGSYEGYPIAISDQNQVTYNLPGYSIFGDIKSGMGLYSIAADSSNTGTGVIYPITADNTTVAQYDYVVEMVTNGSGQLAYKVTNQTTGAAVIPAPPAVTPTDAPQYISGNGIAFDGLNTTIVGEPSLGDKFNITQSTQQSVFQTLQNVINILNTPQTTSADTVNASQQLIEQSASLAGALEHLVSETTRLGERAKQVDDQISLNADIMTLQKNNLSTMANVDLPEVISSLSLQLTSLEMSQQSYIKIQELFSRLMSQQF